ncbi:hypothetical protein CVS40_11950 [Lucilia cuprina]|nr:hypothetical protein CVS40_11950 [Lucilia cuprina]
MLRTLNWMNIKQRMEVNTILFIQKIKTGEAPKYLSEQLNFVGELQPYLLRNTEDFRLRRATNTALFYKGLKLYNLLPNNVKTERNKCIFRKECVKFVKNNTIVFL